MRRPPTNAPGGDLERAEEPDRLRAKSAVDEVRGRMRRVDATAQGYGAEGGLRRNVPRGRPYRSPDGRTLPLKGMEQRGDFVEMYLAAGRTGLLTVATRARLADYPEVKLLKEGSPVTV